MTVIIISREICAQHIVDNMHCQSRRGVMYVVLCNDNKASQIMTTQRTEEVYVA